MNHLTHGKPVVKSISGKGPEKFSEATLREIPPNFKKALERRSRTIQAEQAAFEWERGQIDERHDQITCHILQLATEDQGLAKRRDQIDIEMGQHQESLREIRTILRNGGGSS